MHDSILICDFFLGEIRAQNVRLKCFVIPKKGKHKHYTASPFGVASKHKEGQGSKVTMFCTLNISVVASDLLVWFFSLELQD